LYIVFLIVPTLPGVFPLVGFSKKQNRLLLNEGQRFLSKFYPLLLFFITHQMAKFDKDKFSEFSPFSGKRFILIESIAPPFSQ